MNSSAAGHEAALVAGQKQDSGGDFLGLCDSAKRHRCREAGLRGDNEITLSRLIGMVKGLRQ